MDLWIRSQDRELLLKTKIVELEYFGEDCFTSINTRYDGRNTSLGTYRKKERALEVLNEIHQRLINIQTIEIVGTDYITNQMKNNGIDCVYQMPSE